MVYIYPQPIWQGSSPDINNLHHVLVSGLNVNVVFTSFLRDHTHKTVHHALHLSEFMMKLNFLKLCIYISKCVKCKSNL